MVAKKIKKEEKKDENDDIKKRLAGLTTILQKIAVGNFNIKISIPKKEDELTGLIVAIDLMIEDLRDSEKQHQELEDKLQKKVEELKKAQLFSQGVLDTMQEGVIVVNIKGQIIDINKAFLDTFGHKDKKKILGKNYLSLNHIPIKDIPKYAGVIKDILLRGKIKPTEVESKEVDGKKIYIRFSASILKDEKGKPIAFFAVTRDITELKKTLTDLEKTKNELELKMKEMGRLHALTIGREEKILELKERIKNLEKQQKD